MKSLGSILSKKAVAKPARIDEPTVFYLLNLVIKEEYGNVGREKIQPVRYQDGKLILKIESSNWANEIWTNRERLLGEINRKIGAEEVKEIKV